MHEDDDGTRMSAEDEAGTEEEEMRERVGDEGGTAVKSFDRWENKAGEESEDADEADGEDSERDCK